MRLVRSAAMPNSAHGLAEIENWGKNQCSITVYTSNPTRSAWTICSSTSS
jgi:hypothetical protein